MLVVLLSSVPTVGAAPSPAQVTAVQQKIATAFVAVQQAESRGGNVAGLTASLNQAVQLLQQAEQTSSPSQAATFLAQASSIAGNVTAEAPAVGAQGAAAVQNGLIITGVEVAAIAAACVLVYLYLPRLFWRLWERTHSDWEAKSK
jgi:hypothetical protein